MTEEMPVSTDTVEQAAPVQTEDALKPGLKRASPGAADGQRGEITANTLARMMGLATVVDLKLLENKIDLLTTKISNMTVRMEKVSATMSRVPSGADLERIDVQIGALRTMLREVLGPVVDGTPGKKTDVKIRSNTAAPEKAAPTEPIEPPSEG